MDPIACKAFCHTDAYANISSASAKRICHLCGQPANNPGMIAPPDTAEIAKLIAGRKSNSLRSAAPKHWGQDVSLASRRAYYVWRMARFHGGIDMSMPVMAGLTIADDPFIHELNTLADTVAKLVFGSNMRAARTWGRALGYLG